ncbi:uncharacterized protein JN550_012830 [Neoarthrinium moseri]|uniref:uncharacterized protein n=1 Tax=Neoarthrinium moseri TaxID=1658444 RepID=UPI001FDDE049|nr:uncharacterized protein JN550_012830 [Neoarthrinium moseri]KAI1858299.1 hypothetical protein JN550_012830 [Neoarthrinium moseri]
MGDATQLVFIDHTTEHVQLAQWAKAKAEHPLLYSATENGIQDPWYGAYSMRLKNGPLWTEPKQLAAYIPLSNSNAVFSYKGETPPLNTDKSVNWAAMNPRKGRETYTKRKASTTKVLSTYFLKIQEQYPKYEPAVVFQRWLDRLAVFNQREQEEAI